MVQETKNSNGPESKENDSASSSMSENSGSPGGEDDFLFKLRGAKEKFESPSFLKLKDVPCKLKAEFVPGMARADRPIETVPVAKEDLIEIEFENGERLWLRADDYFERFAPPAARSAPESEVVDVSAQLQLLPAGMQARGPVGWIIKSLKVLGVDLPENAALKLAHAVEERVPDDAEEKKKRPGLGFYRCSPVTGSFSLTPAKLDKTSHDMPCLIFIHGTASSTWGSFGDLWSPERRAELNALRTAYDDRIFAFEHASLTKSPIENALELARVIPEGTRLHLITQSRGGLVGELLCRASVAQEMKTVGDDQAGVIKEWQPFQPDEFRLFERDKKDAEASKQQLDLLRQLDKELKERHFQVERFVRVACPVLGTTLASGRLDRWLSVIGTLAGFALPGSPLSDMFKDIGDFVAAVIKERTDPSSLPGLEAMMPESNFIKLVNWPGVKVPGDLAVIAGDIDPDAWWSRLLVWISDRFYEGDHDLVVNTPSMYGGLKRSGKSLVSFSKGPEVNHFRYFQNSASAKPMVSALTATGDDWEGFEPLEKPTVDIARAVQLRTAEPRPVVFVIPGIMGSELQVGNDHVWLDIPDVIFGGFKQLHIEAKNVKATQPFPRYYGDLIEYLAHSHKVVPFPFDWRLQIEKEADRLAVEIRRELKEAKEHNKPIRILAHSMGGLIARTMIARHETLWRQVCSIPGARLAMLGTPNGGSHAITELLVAQSSILRMIAFLDIRHSKKKLLELISRFPGVLAMLPKDYRDDYFSTATWKNYHKEAGAEWVLPLDKDIKDALKLRQVLDNSPIDPAHMVYVAGRADVTVAEMYLDRHGKKPQIKFLGSTRGDGRVTWDSGILPEVPTWFMDVEHGDLAAYPPAFPALQELLEHGKTSLLSQTAPVSRAEAVLFPMPLPSDELYPDENVLTGAVLGAGSRKRRRTKTLEPPVQVSVVHGNLAYATHPVAVGHYAGDTIISAEKQLDMALSNTLTLRHQLGIYPGAIESNAVFINPKLEENNSATPQGAIVIGLGTVGNLTAAMLTRTVTRGLLEYVTEWCERGPRMPHGNSGQNNNELGVSSLLIGTLAGGVGVNDSVFAVLRAVLQVNQTLANAKHDYRIRKLEFIELYEDRALQAVRALQALKSQLSIEREFIFKDQLHSSESGLRRVFYEEPMGWWQRLQILGGTKDGEPGDGTLRFSASTRRARSEVRLLATQRALVDQFIARSIRTTYDHRLSARTLFELLLPNELKEQAPDQDDLVIIVDEEAARYPWELLEDRWSRSGTPFVIGHGLVRQFESGEFRESVAGVTENSALVIGDPVSQYPELKGAHEEAKAVARTLQSDGRFVTEQRIRPDSEAVINALFARGYRVVHLAGHGVYQMPPKEAIQCRICGQPFSEDKAAEMRKSLKPVTGMIIGDGLVLSPQEVHQMRRVPELVFINCCYLGYIESEKEENLKKANVRHDYNRIAANVATEFIRMGVRAVIAAGWAVDDAAANTFAVTFYEQMLKGRRFGESIKEARKVTYERHPQTNTWGAYQCYGDPDYCLIRRTGEGESHTDKLNLAAPAQAIAELNNITALLKTMAADDTKAEIARIQKIEGEIKEKGWGEVSRLCAALGRAFGEAKCFSQAVDWYRKAVRCDDAEATLHDIEQLSNLEIRWAVREWENGEKTDEVLKRIDRGIERMECLIEGLHIKSLSEEEKKDEETGHTSERLSILGSAYKSRAWVSEANRKNSLEKMKNYFEQAIQLAEKKAQFDPLLLLSYLTGEIVIVWQEGGDKPTDDKAKMISKHLIKAREELTIKFKRNPSFWTAIMLAHVELIQKLSVGRLSNQAINGITDIFLKAKRLGSPREFRLSLDDIDFLIKMAEINHTFVEPLKRLRQMLQ